MLVVVNDNIILVGTAHVSAKSVAEVRAAIQKYRPDIVAVELDKNRFIVLTKKRKWEETSLIDVLKQGKGFLMLAQIFLAMFQRRLGSEYGVEPGAEMVAAIKEAKKFGVEVALVDRDITVTFRRAWRSMTFREKLRLFWYSIKALVGYDRLMEEDELELELEKEGKKGKEPEKHDDPVSYPDGRVYSDGATAQKQHCESCFSGNVCSFGGHPVSPYQLHGRSLVPAIRRGSAGSPSHAAVDRP